MAEPMAEQRVNVRHTQTGEIISVPVSSLQAAADQGFVPETYAEEQARADREDYGNQGLAAALQGVARTITLGGSDVLSRAVGTDDVTRKLREQNPGAALTGEVLGAVVPVGAAGAAATAGRGARSLIGRATERTILKSVGGGVAEGAVFGAGQGISNAALSADPQSAEDIIAGIGSSALLGGVAGGALTGGGALLGRGLEVGRDALRNVVERRAATEAASAAGPKGIGDDLLEAMAGGPASKTEAVSAMKQRVRGLKAESLAEQERLAAGRPMVGEADEAVARAGQDLQRLEAATQGFKSDLEKLDSGLRQVRKQAEKAADETTEAILQRVEAARAEVQKHFRYDWEAGANARTAKKFKFGMTDDELRATLAKPEAQAAIREAEAARLELNRALRPDTEYTTRLGTHLDDAAALAPQEAQLRAAVENRLRVVAGPIHSEKLAATEAMAADLERAIAAGSDPTRAAREFVERAEGLGFKATRDDLVKYAEASGYPAAGVGDDVLGVRIKAGFYRDAAKAAKVERAAAARSAAREGAIGEKLGERAAEWVGAGAGALIGGPIGAAVGYGVGKLVGSPAGMLFRRLWTHRAAAAKKIADGIDAFIKVAPRSSTPAVGTATSVLRRVRYAPADPAAPEALKQSRQAAAKARILELKRAVGDPVGTRKAIHARLSNLWASDPQLADQLETLAVKRLEFLNSKVAGPPPPAFGRTEHANWHLTDTEIDRFERYAAAAEGGPARMLEEAARGRLSMETVETVKALYPTAFAAIQKELITRIPELRAELPFHRRLMLGVLFEAPVDATQEPDRMAAFAARFQAAHEARAAEGVSKADVGSISLKAKSTPTQAQRASAGPPTT